jgi:hypothetical protein
MRFAQLFRWSVALPSDHGSWVFIVSPLAIGLAAGGRMPIPALYLIIAVFAGFLVRQPITTGIKVLSRRRSKKYLPAAVFWTATYASIGLVHVVGLVLRGFGYLLYLAIPGMLVFIWYLALVAQRKERRLIVEVLATGVLALSAPAGLWAGVGRPVPIGWLLWLLVWMQGIASILHVYARLEQRRFEVGPTRIESLALSKPALLVGATNVLVVLSLGQMGFVAVWLFLPYLLQFVETVGATISPTRGARPTAIGIRQLVVSALFSLLFILGWS